MERFLDIHKIDFSKEVPRDILRNIPHFGILLSPYLKQLLRINEYEKLYKYYNPEEAATVKEAYELKEFILDFHHNRQINLKEYFKIINSGTIDRYISLWGIKEMKYIKAKFKQPCALRKVLKERFPLRYEQSCSKKLILSGMVKGFEAMIDDKGEFLAGKSTVIIRKTTNWGELKIMMV